LRSNDFHKYFISKLLSLTPVFEFHQNGDHGVGISYTKCRLKICDQQAVTKNFRFQLVVHQHLKEQPERAPSTWQTACLTKAPNKKHSPPNLGAFFVLRVRE
jgi:hypothetical protein